MTNSLPVSWATRPPEEARLLNPAFVALLVHKAADAHFKTCARPLAWPLSFLIAPAVMHQETRVALPSSVNTSMASWLGQRPEQRLMLAGRAFALAPAVREALLFGLRGGLLEVTGEGSIRALRLRRRRASEESREPTTDFRACMSASTFMGRWCARNGTPATVMALWRIRP